MLFGPLATEKNNDTCLVTARRLPKDSANIGLNLKMTKKWVVVQRNSRIVSTKMIMRLGD